MLFVYNHDGDYDKSFDEFVSNMKYEELRVPKGTRLILFGPQEIRWLDNIRYEIVYMRGKKQLPEAGDCSYKYPELMRRKNVQPSLARAATVEMLTGPWILLEHGPIPAAMNVAASTGGIVVFYKGKGENTEEFLYLIDSLMSYQMIKPNVRIRIRLLDAADHAQKNFRHAQDEYIKLYGGGTEIETLLRAIEFGSIANVHTSFSTEDIGYFRG